MGELTPDDSAYGRAVLTFFASKDVVGDTFVVGCEIPTDKIVYSDTFGDNPDLKHPTYSTKCGIYEPNCGLDKVMISWGHDEYLVSLFQEPDRPCIVRMLMSMVVHGLQKAVIPPSSRFEHDPISLFLPLASREGLHLS